MTVETIRIHWEGKLQRKEVPKDFRKYLTELNKRLKTHACNYGASPMFAAFLLRGIPDARRRIGYMEGAWIRLCRVQQKQDQWSHSPEFYEESIIKHQFFLRRIIRHGVRYCTFFEIDVPDQSQEVQRFMRGEDFDFVEDFI